MQRAQSHCSTLHCFKLDRDCSDAAENKPLNNPKIQQQQIIVQGLCNDHPSTFFVDTGSSVSLVSKAFTDFLGVTEQALNCKASLQSFTADKITTYGELQLNVRIAGCNVNHSFIITDLVDTTCLLGMDFLTGQNISINMSQRTLFSPHGKTNFLRTLKQLQNKAAVKCARRQTIPPNTVAFIKCKADTDDFTYSALLEPKVIII